MTAPRKLAASLLSFALIAGLVTVPFIGDASAKPGSLTSKQRTEFKQQKAVLKQRQKAIQQRLRDVMPQNAKAKRELDAAKLEHDNAKKVVDDNRSLLRDRLAIEQASAARKGEPFQPSPTTQSLRNFVSAQGDRFEAITVANLKRRTNPLRGRGVCDRLGVLGWYYDLD